MNQSKNYFEEGEISSVNELFSDAIQPGQSTEVNRNMPSEAKNELLEVVGDGILDVLWNNIYYLTTNTSTSVTMSSSTEDTSAKDVDTSEGKFLSPTRDARLRMNFYLGSGQTNSTVYICSLGTNSSFASYAPLETSSNIGYTGIKIVQTEVYMVSKKLGSIEERTVKTSATITDDATHVLELYYRPESTDAYLDNDYIGSITNDLINGHIVKAVYPFLTSVKSSSGSVNLTIEGYEFAQIRGRR